jgi:GAF domain-containing protein
MDVTSGAVLDKSDDRLAALAWLARGLDRAQDLGDTLEAVVGLAGRADLGDSVGLLMVTGRTISASVASDPDVRRATELQLECNQGPGVESILTHRSFVSADLRLDERWRFWGPRAADAGWLSVLSVRLADGDTFGSLNVYSRQIDSFSSEDVAVAEAFAAHAAIALGNAKARRTRLEAVQARRLLTEAQDIVGRRLHVDADQAFSVLRRNAARSNKKISELAAEVVGGLLLPDFPPAPAALTTSASTARTPVGAPGPSKRRTRLTALWGGISQ